MTLNNAYEKDHLEKNNIREVVWHGPEVQTGNGCVLRGLAGRTDAGEYKAGMGTLPEISGKKSGREYGLEIFDWSKETYGQKDQAVSVAREWVAESEKHYRGCERPVRKNGDSEKSPAKKYGAGESLQTETPPPSRSRR
jgi:hypothetical protein